MKFTAGILVTQWKKNHNKTLRERERENGVYFGVSFESSQNVWKLLTLLCTLRAYHIYNIESHNPSWFLWETCTVYHNPEVYEFVCQWCFTWYLVWEYSIKSLYKHSNIKTIFYATFCIWNRTIFRFISFLYFNWKYTILCWKRNLIVFLHHKTLAEVI